MLPTLSHISQTFLRPYLHSIDSFPSTLLQLLPPPPTVFSQHSTFIGQAALPLFLPKTPHLTAVGSQCREARAEAKISSPCRSLSVPADRNQSPPQDSFCSFFFSFYDTGSVIAFSHVSLYSSAKNHYSPKHWSFFPFYCHCCIYSVHIGWVSGGLGCRTGQKHSL